MAAAPRRQRILITGASSGLGAEMARQFHALGRDVVVCARRTERLDALRAELGPRVHVRALDVDDHDAVFDVIGLAAEQLGGLDRVIVNAGIGKGAPVGSGRFDANRATLETNLVSALAQCEAALQVFRAAGTGHLVTIASVSALRGMPGAMTAYVTSKAGLLALTDGLRLELDRTGIAVTALLPGYIESEMSRGRHPLKASTEKGVQTMVRAIEREPGRAVVPAWPWRVAAPLLRVAPAPVLRRFI